MDDELEHYVNEYGEEYRAVIDYALRFIDEMEPQWNLDEPFDRPAYILSLIEFLDH